MKTLSINKAGRTKTRKNSRGVVLPVTMMIVAIVIILALFIVDKVVGDYNLTRRDSSIKRAFYLAETGLVSGLHEFASTNYSKTTHDTNGNPLPAADRMPATLPDTRTDSPDGWYYWEWNPGDSYASLTNSGKPEKFRYRVYYDNSNWVVESEGIFDGSVKRLKTSGTLEPIFRYAIFSNGDMGEFVRGKNQTITGKIHSNGDLYIRPSGTVLTIVSNKVTSAGRIIRFEDNWGRPDRGGTVKIRGANGVLKVMNGNAQGASGKGKAFDSFNPAWLDPTDGALAFWGGVVKDAALGASYVKPPPLETMEEGGYFYNAAGLVILPSTADGNGITTKTFYNNAEERYETVKELDLAAIDWPSNNVIYSSTPIRLVNGAKLKNKLTVVSNSDVYTIGDINKEYGDEASFHDKKPTKKPMAIMTTQRIYHLSGNWKDSDNNVSSDTIPAAGDDPLYSGDKNKVLEINAALVDGAPIVDEINYVKSHSGVDNPYYTGSYVGGLNAVANSDDFLEDWNGLTVQKRGSIVHMGNSRMAAFDNSNAGPGRTAWVRRSHYEPPERDYQYDPDLEDVTKQPPGQPLVSSASLWVEEK